MSRDFVSRLVNSPAVGGVRYHVAQYVGGAGSDAPNAPPHETFKTPPFPTSYVIWQNYRRQKGGFAHHKGLSLILHCDGLLWVQLSEEKWTVCDAIDFESIAGRKWYAAHDRAVIYARAQDVNPSSGKRTVIQFHRLILNPPKGLVIDHRNHNGLDNRRCNLRICTVSENTVNSRRNATSTGYVGVRIGDNCYIASIHINGKLKQLGRFSNLKEAIAVRKSAEKKYYGEFIPQDRKNGL